MSGFGISPGASSPFGIGTPDAPTEIPRAGAGSRYINPASGDYQIDPVTRQQAQMPGVRQRMLICLVTVQQSSTALRRLGSKMPRKMGTAYEAECRAAVLEAARQLTEIEKVARIDDIQVQRGAAGRSRILVAFTDLTTGTPEVLETDG